MVLLSFPMYLVMLYILFDKMKYIWKDKIIRVLHLSNIQPCILKS